MTVYAEAALQFLDGFLPTPYRAGTRQDLQTLISMNVTGAFLCYHVHARAAYGEAMDVRHWKWPYECLDNMSFPGDEPWAVLFRHALELRLRVAGLLTEETHE